MHVLRKGKLGRLEGWKEQTPPESYATLLAPQVEVCTWEGQVVVEARWSVPRRLQNGALRSPRVGCCCCYSEYIPAQIGWVDCCVVDGPKRTRVIIVRADVPKEEGRSSPCRTIKLGPSSLAISHPSRVATPLLPNSESPHFSCLPLRDESFVPSSRPCRRCESSRTTIGRHRYQRQISNPQ